MFSILFVDDSEDIIELGKMVLEASFNAKVYGVSNSEDAEVVIRDLSTHIDAVVCDYNPNPHVTHFTLSFSTNPDSLRGNRQGFVRPKFKICYIS